MSELVSILMPAYNAEKWIKDSLHSALSQTWPKKEIVVVDDGSSDHTLAVARKFESGSIKVLSQARRGASAARNKALEYAQGDYIQWLDADDLLALNKIAEQMRIAERGRQSLTLLSAPHGLFYYRIQKARFIPNALWQDLAPAEWIINKFTGNLWMHPSVWLVSRKLTEMAGPWDERLSLDDDGEYFCRVIAASDGIRFVPQARCYYRSTGFGQLSRSASENALKSILLSRKLCIQYLRSLEDSERTRRASLDFLQRLLPLCYPERTELIEEINAFAAELGGTLRLPEVEWKFDLARRVLGWKRAKAAHRLFRRLKLAGQVKWDEILHRIALII